MSNTIYSESNTSISFDNEIELAKSYLQSLSKKYNYVYLITEISTNKKYIGVRSCDIPIKKDLGSIYKSSSTDLDFINRQKTNKKDYRYEVLANYNCRLEASMEEIRLHNLYEVDVNPDYFNKAKATLSKFTGSGKVNVYDQEGKRLSVFPDDPKYISGEYISIAKDMVASKDKNGKTYYVPKSDLRLLSGELVGVNKGRVNVIDEDGNIFKTSVDNPDYISGKLKYYCGENGSSAKGKIAVKDKDGKKSMVYKDDPLYLSGDLIPVHKGMITAVDEFGVKHRISTSHPDYVSGKLKSIYVQNKNHVAYAKDRYGNLYTITKGDKRLLTGELINVCALWYSINGAIYSAIEAEKEFGVKTYTIKSRCKSDLLEWKDWFIIL